MFLSYVTYLSVFKKQKKNTPAAQDVSRLEPVLLVPY
jgi:hypothetical protein